MHLLTKEMRRSGASFKAAVNHFLRIGLMASKKPSRNAFVVVPRKLGLPHGLAYDNVEQLLEKVEGEIHS